MGRSAGSAQQLIFEDSMPLSIRRPHIAVFCAFAMSMGYNALSIYGPLLARERLGASPALLGWYAFAFNALYVLAALAAGAICERLGCRRAMAHAALILAAAGVGMLFARHRFLALGPFLAWGLSGGVFWAALEGAIAEGQPPERLKRGMSCFSFSWMSGSFAGAFLGGWLYQAHSMAPFVFCAAMSLLTAAAASRPAWFEIAPWRAGRAHDDEARASAEKRRLFVRLAFVANFGIFLVFAAIRSLLPEYAATIDLTGRRYGAVLSSMMLGALLSTAVLTFWHGWHYSGRALVGAQCLAAAALCVFSFAKSLGLLCAMQLAVGAAMGLTYFSSIFYGMEWNENKGAHGGRHEAVIGVALGVGPMFGGWLIEWTRWPRAAFLATAFALAALAGLQAAWLWRSRRGAGHSPALAGAESSAAAASPAG